MDPRNCCSCRGLVILTWIGFLILLCKSTNRKSTFRRRLVEQPTKQESLPKSIYEDGPWRLPLFNKLTLSPDIPDPVYTTVELEEEARVREKVSPGSKIPRLLWMACKHKPGLDHWGNGTFLHYQHNYTADHRQHHKHGHQQHGAHHNLRHGHSDVSAASNHNNGTTDNSNAHGAHHPLLNHLQHLFMREIFAPKAATTFNITRPKKHKTTSTITTTSDSTSNNQTSSNNITGTDSKPSQVIEEEEEQLYFADIDGVDAGRHPLGWRLKYFDHEEQLAFMRKYFANTSTLWAYEMISPYAGPSMADMWRYAVLYIWGGVYLDDDAMIGTPFDEVSYLVRILTALKLIDFFSYQVITPNDSMIVSFEKNKFQECYYSTFHLAKANMLERYPNSSLVNESLQEPSNPFHQRVIVNWGIFVKPRHPAILHTLKNAVEIIKLEYFRHFVIAPFSYYAMYCVCGTGPIAFGSSIIEAKLLYGEENVPVRVTNYFDFHDYWGHSKVKESTRVYYEGGEAYGRLMQRYNTKLLKEHIPESLHGRLVTIDKRALYFVIDETRYGFRDWDAFVAFDFGKHHVPVETISHEEFGRLKTSDIVFTEKDIPRVLKVLQDKIDMFQIALRDSFEGKV